MFEIHAVISGRVQLVMFRDFVQRRARSMKIKGTVQNLKNGNVEVVAQGEEENLKKFLTLLHTGSLLSRVDKVSVIWRNSSEKFDSFTILF